MNTGPAYDVVLFDLDGTLSDSAPGILASLRHAFAASDLAPMDPHTERAILGPPFYESLPPLIGQHMVWPVIEAYREHYRAGAMFDTRVYDGIPEVLRAARAAGCRLAVATSKPEVYAVPILEHLGLAGYFDTIGGDDTDGSLKTKALVINTVLGRLEDVDPERCVMVGDREHDVFGAREHGIECLGAGWGYGADGELSDAGAIAICEQPSALIQHLGLSV